MLQCALELIHAHAGVIAVDRHETRFVAGEGLQRSQISWVLDNNRVSALKKHFSDEVYALLGSGSYQYSICDGLDSSQPHSGSKPFTQRAPALGGAVLQRRRAFVRKHILIRASEVGDWEQFRSRKPSGERYDFWTLGHFEDLANS